MCRGVAGLVGMAPGLGNRSDMLDEHTTFKATKPCRLLKAPPQRKRVVEKPRRKAVSVTPSTNQNLSFCMSQREKATSQRSSEERFSVEIGLQASML